MRCIALFALSGFSVALADNRHQPGGGHRHGHVPTQLVYDHASAVVKDFGPCNLLSWDGVDPYGMVGPPWVSYVTCLGGGEFVAEGVAQHGDFQVWLQNGTMTGNGETLEGLGESFWVADGAHAEIRVKGSAYIVGAKFELIPGEEAVFTSSFQGPKARTYPLKDAGIAPDKATCNGTSASMDFAWTSNTGVDPPAGVAMNCAEGSTAETNYIWSHFHPFGCVYMPLSGKLCFHTDEVVCVEPGTARWTSPNLQYYEHFEKINETNLMANNMRSLAGVKEEDCEYPIAYAITNLDVASPAGLPNMDDWPLDAHSNPMILGKAPWGVFPRMAVQNTRVRAVTSTAVDYRGLVV